jgi:hypothetical protein
MRLDRVVSLLGAGQIATVKSFTELLQTSSLLGKRLQILKK